MEGYSEVGRILAVLESRLNQTKLKLTREKTNPNKKSFIVKVEHELFYVE